MFLALGAGTLIGFTLGLIGGGGSILATPLLLYVVGVANPHVALGTGALAVSVNDNPCSKGTRLVALFDCVRPDRDGWRVYRIDTRQGN